MAVDRQAVERILERAEARNRATLLEPEVYKILAAAAIDVPSHAVFWNADEIDDEVLESVPGLEVVAKVVSPRIAHKSEFGGVRFIAKTADAVRAVLHDFARRAAEQELGPVGVLVAERLDLRTGPGAELLLSLRLDRAFGPVISFGLGGVTTEYWGKNLRAGRTLAIRPANDLAASPRVAAEMVSGTVAGDFLAGRVRGQEAPLVAPGTAEGAVQALAELAEAFNPLNHDGPWTLEELEINPLAVDAHGRLVALDGLGRFSQTKEEVRPRPVRKLKSLLEPKLILLIGVSSRAMNPGRIILRNLLASPRYSPKTLGIMHPTEKLIDGVACYRSPEQLPNGIDMAVVTVPASDELVDMMIELAQLGKVETFTLISSGFGETAAGEQLQQRLHRFILETRDRPDGGILVNGPNCLGIVSSPGDYNTFFLPPYKLAIHKDGVGGDNLASVSQSGAFLVCQMSRLGHYITPRYSISFGNQIDVSVSDYVRYFSREEKVKVISVYVEGFQPFDGRALIAASQEARAAGKAIIIYKTGRTAAGAKAASSHTAAIAGDYAVAEQCFEHAGIQVASDLESFAEWMKVYTLLGNRRVRGRRVAIMTNAGFETTVASDRLGYLKLADFAPHTWERMRAGLPKAIVDFRNPLDATPITPTPAYLNCVDAMAEDPNVDCLLISCVPLTLAVNVLPPGAGHKENLYSEDSLGMGFVRIFKRTRKPMVFCVDAGEIYDPLVNLLQDHGAPTFRRIDDGMLALSNFVRDRLARQRDGATAERTPERTLRWEVGAGRRAPRGVSRGPASASKSNPSKRERGV